MDIVDRDIKDAQSGVSADWKFNIAYNAALQLCTMLLNASGYRPEKSLAHYRTLGALPLILGDNRKNDADYLETCRKMRNSAEYDSTGVATDAEAKQLVAFAKSLRTDVLSWLKKNRSDLSP